MCEQKAVIFAGLSRYCNEKRLSGKNMDFSGGARSPCIGKKRSQKAGAV
jgi:hypothetical protein